MCDIYTGKNKTRCVLNADVLDPDSTQTTEVILGLMQKEAEATMFIWITTTAAQIYFWNFIIRNALLVGHVGKIRKICQKQ